MFTRTASIRAAQLVFLDKFCAVKSFWLEAKSLTADCDVLRLDFLLVKDGRHVYR